MKYKGIAMGVIRVDLIEEVSLFIQKYRLIEQGNKILVGVSGGPDSVALLHILWVLRDRYKMLLHVLHLNHLLRGEEANADEILVAGLAKELKIPYSIEKVDVRLFQKEKRFSLQEAARKMRFDFFEKECHRLQADKVALGHHADDQAETILFNILRGSGISGLSGISPKRDIYIRPLLDVRRRTIEEYCKKNFLPTCLDSSNLKPVYTRNRIRLHLLPILEREYNPRVTSALTRLGKICREENTYLEQQAQDAFQRTVTEKSQSRLVLNEGLLVTEPLVFRRRILRIAWQQISGETSELSYDHVERLLRLIQSGKGALVLPCGIRVVKVKSKLILHRQRQPAQGVSPYTYPLSVPGMTFIPELKLDIQAEILPLARAPSWKELGPKEALLDFNLIEKPLWVRQRKEGDIFSPLGLGGKIKLKKFLINNKIPKVKRERVPLIVSGEEIVWVGGLRISERWKVTEKTKTCLYLRIKEHDCCSD